MGQDVRKTILRDNHDQAGSDTHQHVGAYSAAQSNRSRSNPIRLPSAAAATSRMSISESGIFTSQALIEAYAASSCPKPTSGVNRRGEAGTVEDWRRGSALANGAVSGIACRGCNARSVLNECRAAYATSPCLFPSYRQSRGYRLLFSRRKNGVAHLSARSTIFGFDLFPEPQPSQLEFRKLFANFLLKQSFSVSLARRRPPETSIALSRLLLTNKTRPRFAATSLDDFAIPGPCRSRTNRPR